MAFKAETDEKKDTSTVGSTAEGRTSRRRSWLCWWYVSFV